MARNDIDGDADGDTCGEGGAGWKVQSGKWTRRHTPMCDGKCVDTIDSREVAAARACRVVSGVSSSGKRGAARGRGGQPDQCGRKETAGGFAERMRLPGAAGG